MYARGITLYNVTLTTLNTEYPQILQAGVKSLKIQAQTAVAVRFAFVKGLVATPISPYYTVKSGTVFELDGLNLSDSATTIYLASGTSGTVAEVLASA